MPRQGRKRREDPTQENLVEKKHQVSEQYTELKDVQNRIKNILRLTLKGMHGHPVPELGIAEKSDIKNPLPEQVSSGVNEARSLTQKYEQLADQILAGINDVMSMQSQYSGSRRKPQPKQPQQMQPLEQQEPVQEMVEQMQQQPEPVAELERNPELQTAASDRITRTVAIVKGLGQLGDKTRWDRLSLLRGFAQIKREMRSLMNQVLSRGRADSIFDAVQTTNSIMTKLHNEVGLLESLANKRAAGVEKPEIPEAPGGEPEGEGKIQAEVRALSEQKEAIDRAENLMQSMQDMPPDKKARVAKLIGLLSQNPESDLWKKIQRAMNSYEKKQQEQGQLEPQAQQPEDVQVEEPPEQDQTPVGWDMTDMMSEALEIRNRAAMIKSYISQNPALDATQALNTVENINRMYNLFDIKSNSGNVEEATQGFRQLQSMSLTLEQQAAELGAPAKSAEAVSGSLGRWWGRTSLNLIQSGRLARFRRQADRHFSTAFDTLDSLLDELETRNWSPNSIAKKAIKFLQEFKYGMKSVGYAAENYNASLRKRRQTGDLKKGDLEGQQAREVVVNKFTKDSGYSKDINGMIARLERFA